MRETYSDALIAYQIGDYAKVIEKLTTLTSTELMTTEQNQAVQDMLEKAKAGAASAAASNAPRQESGTQP